MIYHTEDGDFWVLSRQHCVASVSSANAWVDSGDYEEVILWSTDYRVTFVNDHVEGTYNSNHPVPPVVLGRARDFNDAVVWLRRVQSDIYNARHRPHLKQGDTVLVFKGRKAPRGTYTVLETINGRYGPCYTLRSADGAVYQFVTEANVRRVCDPLSVPGVPDSYLPMLDALAREFPRGNPAAGASYHAGLALADAMEEVSDPRAPQIRAYANYYLNPDWVAGERGPLAGRRFLWRGRFAPLPIGMTDERRRELIAMAELNWAAAAELSPGGSNP